MNKEIIDVLDGINSFYRECRKEKLSRMSMKWGVWSSDMNKEIRKQIEADHPLGTHLKYLFIYWINRSQLLEYHFKYPQSRKREKRLLIGEGRSLRAMLHRDELIEECRSLSQIAASDIFFKTKE